MKIENSQRNGSNHIPHKTGSLKYWQFFLLLINRTHKRKPYTNFNFMAKVKNELNTAPVQVNATIDTNGQTETAETKESPVPDSVVIEPETAETLTEKIKAAKNSFAAAMMNDAPEQDSLHIAWLKAKKALAEFEAKSLQLENQAKIDGLRKTEFNRVEALLELFSASNFAQDEYKAGRQTMEQANEALETFKAAKTFIQEELAKHVVGGKNVIVRNTLHIPAGMSGAALAGATERGAKTAEIVERYKGYIAQGLTDAAARKELIATDGFNDGTTGAAVRNYLKSIS